MQIDYLKLRTLLDIRLKQIEQDSLVYEDLNREYIEINNMKKSIDEILVSQKYQQQEKIDD